MQLAFTVLTLPKTADYDSEYFFTRSTIQVKQQDIKRIFKYLDCYEVGLITSESLALIAQRRGM